MDLDTFLHLHLHGIALQRHEHPAVMTCAEPDRLVNTATAIVTHGDVVRFLAASGHAARVVDVPVRTLGEVAA